MAIWITNHNFCLFKKFEGTTQTHQCLWMEILENNFFAFVIQDLGIIFAHTLYNKLSEISETIPNYSLI